MLLFTRQEIDLEHLLMTVRALLSKLLLSSRLPIIVIDGL